MGNNEIDDIELREIGCSRYLKESTKVRIRKAENEEDWKEKKDGNDL